VTKAPKKTAAPSVAQQMAALTELVEQLEDPGVELEAALKLYEEGVKLSSAIQKTLESAEQRVAQIAADGTMSDAEELSDDE